MLLPSCSCGIVILQSFPWPSGQFLFQHPHIVIPNLWACHAELVSASPLFLCFHPVILHSFPWPALGQALFRNLCSVMLNLFQHLLFCFHLFLFSLSFCTLFLGRQTKSCFGISAVSC